MGVIHSSAFNFAEIVQRFIREVGDDAIEETFETVDAVSKEAVQKLREASRAQFGRGPYARGWKRQWDRGRLRVGVTVHGGKPTYRLAHLLEKGHVISNGTGRTFGKSDGRVHIEPVAEWASDEAFDRIVSRLEKRL